MFVKSSVVRRLPPSATYVIYICVCIYMYICIYVYMYIYIYIFDRLTELVMYLCCRCSTIIRSYIDFAPLFPGVVFHPPTPTWGSLKGYMSSCMYVCVYLYIELQDHVCMNVCMENVGCKIMCVCDYACCAARSCVYVCCKIMYVVCMYVFGWEIMYVVCMYARMYVWVCVSMCVCVALQDHVCTCVYMYVCMYVCMHVCMCAMYMYAGPSCVSSKGLYKYKIGAHLQERIMRSRSRKQF